jgi:hypothetical protein
MWSAFTIDGMPDVDSQLGAGVVDLAISINIFECLGVLGNGCVLPTKLHFSFLFFPWNVLSAPDIFK